jgi:predicted flavoprotein YhiN
MVDPPLYPGAMYGTLIMVLLGAASVPKLGGSGTMANVMIAFVVVVAPIPTALVAYTVNM